MPRTRRATRSAACLRLVRAPDADAPLVSAAQAGDAQAFQTLVRKYRDKVVSLAYSVVGNTPDAVDVSQDAWLKVHRSLGRFEGKSSFYTWLYRITMNLAIDLRRKHVRRNETLYDDALAPPGAEEREGDWSGPDETRDQANNPLETAATAEMAALIRAAIDELPEHHRQVILLREIEGLSYNQIAEILQCHEGTVMSRLHYARLRLRERLAPYVPGA